MGYKIRSNLCHLSFEYIAVYGTSGLSLQGYLCSQRSLAPDSGPEIASSEIKLTLNVRCGATASVKDFVAPFSHK